MSLAAFTNHGLFFQTMKKYGTDKFMEKLENNGIDCLDTFTKLKDSDYDTMGFKIGEKIKCLTASESIRNLGVSKPDSLEKSEL